RRGVDYQPVGAKSFPVEENIRCKSQGTIKIFRHVLGVRRNIDAQFRDQGLGYCTVGSGTFDRKSSAISETELITYPKLISLGMATEVIVVVEDENPRFCSGDFAEIVSSGETTDSSSDHNQIVGFTGISGLAGLI